MSTRLRNRLRAYPKSVLAIGILFAGTGLLDLYWGLSPLGGGTARWEGDNLEVLGIGTAALVGGVWALRGCNWARWLLAIWMVLHIGLSARQAPRPLRSTWRFSLSSLLHSSTPARRIISGAEKQFDLAWLTSISFK